MINLGSLWIYSLFVIDLVLGGVRLVSSAWILLHSLVKISHIMNLVWNSIFWFYSNSFSNIYGNTSRSVTVFFDFWRKCVKWCSSNSIVKVTRSQVWSHVSELSYFILKYSKTVKNSFSHTFHHTLFSLSTSFLISTEKINIHPVHWLMQHLRIPILILYTMIFKVLFRNSKS